MTINELIETAHADAKAKGFWDEPRNTGELLMLIVSECGEALEAHRKGKRCKGINSIQWPQDITSSSKELDGSEFCYKDLFEVHVKDTFEDELADIVIRIADLLGSLEYAWDERVSSLNLKQEHENVGQSLLQVVRWVSGFRENGTDGIGNDGRSTFLMGGILGVFCIANTQGIDLWRHIELKLAYNRTRPHKHGKAY